MKKIITTSLLLLFFCLSIYKSQAQAPLSANDFKNSIGKWQGSLTYLDYSSGKPYTMPADIVITRIGKTKQFILNNIYPNEKSANNTDTLVISDDGKYIGNEMVKTKRKLSTGELEIITEERGTDGNDNKPAIFRFTYTIGKNSFKKRKDVQFIGDTIWINRHEYSYKR